MSFPCNVNFCSNYKLNNASKQTPFAAHQTIRYSPALLTYPNNLMTCGWGLSFFNKDNSERRSIFSEWSKEFSEKQEKEIEKNEDIWRYIEISLTCKVVLKLSLFVFCSIWGYFCFFSNVPMFVCLFCSCFWSSLCLRELQEQSGKNFQHLKNYTVLIKLLLLEDNRHHSVWAAVIVIVLVLVMKLTTTTTTTITTK